MISCVDVLICCSGTIVIVFRGLDFITLWFVRLKKITLLYKIKSAALFVKPKHVILLQRRQACVANCT